MREGIILRCDACRSENYITKKDKRNHPEKIVVKKYCKQKCHKHVLHKEKK